jgi:hypothetical protein
MTAHQMIRLLDDDHHRAEALTLFVSGLGPDDAKLLADLLGVHSNGARPAEPSTPQAADGKDAE